MVMDCHRERLLGDILANNVLIKQAADFHRLRHTDIRRLASRILVQLLVEDAFANVDAAIADVNAGTGDEFADLGMAFATKRAHREVGSAGHNCGA